MLLGWAVPPGSESGTSSGTEASQQALASEGSFLVSKGFTGMGPYLLERDLNGRLFVGGHNGVVTNL